MESAESPYLTPPSELSGGLHGWLSRNETRLVTALGIVLAVRLWICPLASSFWIDETATVWSITGEFKDLISHLHANFPSMPLYSVLMWAWSRIAGMSEVALRLPSVISVSVAALLLWQAARKLSGNVTAAYTLLALVSLSHVSFAASDARPYGIAILCTVWAFFEGVRWSQTGRVRHLFWQGIAFGLAMTSHYLLGIAVAANALYILVASRNGWIRSRLALLVPPLVAFVVLAPSIPLLLDVARTQRDHAFTNLPSWTDLGVALVPPRWIIAATAGIAIAWIFGRHRTAGPAKTDTRIVVMLAIWTATPAVILFAYSLVSGVPVMVPRYLLSQTPGIVLLGAYAACRLQFHQRFAVAVVLFAVCAVTTGRTIRTRHDPSDWRGASATINQLRKQEPTVPVLMGSGFIESKNIPVPAPAEYEEYMLSPLKAYPVAGPVSMLPAEMTAANSQYVHSLFQAAAGSHRFVVLIPASSHLTDWVYGRFDSEFTITRLQSDPFVLLLEKRSAR